MHDRRLTRDDDRGLVSDVKDNVNPTLNSFRLFIEPRIAPYTQVSSISC